MHFGALIAEQVPSQTTGEQNVCTMYGSAEVWTQNTTLVDYFLRKQTVLPIIGLKINGFLNYLFSTNQTFQINHKRGHIGRIKKVNTTYKVVVPKVTAFVDMMPCFVGF